LDADRPPRLLESRLMGRKLPRKFYSRTDTVQIARELLGKLLVVPDENGRRVSGMIVETEAYLGVEDSGAHSYGGRRTARNEVMYGIAGHVYVFFVYGMYYQFNVVTGPADHPHAILIRGVEPVDGIDTMRERRGDRIKKDRDLTSGPGKLAIAMGIDPGFGSSKFGFCILMLEDDIIKVVYAKEFERPSYEDMLSLAVQLRGQYKPQKIYVDGAKPDFIKSLKVQVREPSDYDRIIAQATHDKVDIEYRMKVVPINFNEYGRELLGRAQNIVSKGWFAVSPITHKELVTQMRMARAKENGNLDKEETANSTYDVFDSFRLALKMFNMPRR